MPVRQRGGDGRLAGPVAALQDDDRILGGDVVPLHVFSLPQFFYSQRFIADDAGQVCIERDLLAKVIGVWWQYIIIVAVLILGAYGFIVLTGFETRLLTRKTKRNAESLYGNYADSERRQRKYAKERGGEWNDDEPGHTP